MKIVATVLCAAFFVCVPASASIAQSIPACLPHADMVAWLKATYEEQKIGRGGGQRGASVVELFVSATGTWTILVTPTNGMSCIATSGDNWTTSPLLAGKPT